MTLKFRTAASLGALVATLGFAAPAIAQSAPTKSDTAAFDRIWDAAVLHKGAKGDVLNDLRIVGRINLDQYVVDSDQGDDTDLVVRRARIGATARMFDHLEIAVQADLNLEGGGPVYNKLTDASLAWTFSKAARLTVGKQNVEFTLDGLQSANRLLTIDRSNVSNNFWFPNEYLTGASLKGDVGRWKYQAAVYSSGKSNREFGKFDAGHVIIVGAGRDFADVVGNKQALVRVDYVYNKPDARADLTRPFEHVVSLTGMFDQGKWGASGGLVVAKGFPGQSDGFGADLVGWLNLSKKLQAVGRYTYMSSETVNGLRLARYENVIVSGRGDRYNEIYGGLNWYIYGHKLKLQTGLAYATMRDRANDGGAYSGINWTTGLRVSW